MLSIRRQRWHILIFALILVWVLGDIFLKGSGSVSLRLVITKLMLLIVTGTLLVINRRSFSALWHKEGSGFNLAVFRIVFFGFFLVGYFAFGMKHIEKALLSLVSLPPEARVPLPFIGWFSEWIPVNETLSKIGIYVLLISSLFACVGYKTRWAIGLFTVCALYIFGVPQLFGKVNHNHEIVWFPAVLLFSGCGDFLSVDCRLKNHSWKACWQSVRSKRYGRALSGIWLLIGIIYFFPGFQKIWQCGLDWIFSDNLINLVHQKSLELPNWQPVLSLDDAPYLSCLMAAAAVVFELGFVFAIAQPIYRPVAIIAGVLFHVFTWLFFKIFFIVLVVSYVSFIDWEKLFKISSSSNATPENTTGMKALNGIFAFLLAGNIACGFFNIHSWPLTAYPSFSILPGAEAEALEFEKVFAHGRAEIIALEDFHEFFPEERFRAMEFKAIQLYKEKKYVELKQLTEGFARKVEPHAKIKVYLVKIRWDKGGKWRERNPEPILEME